MSAPIASHSQQPSEPRPRLNCGKPCGRADFLWLVQGLGMDPAIAARLLGFDPPASDSERTEAKTTASTVAGGPSLATTKVTTTDVKSPPLWRVVGPVVSPGDPNKQQAPALLNGARYQEQDLAGTDARPPTHVPIIPHARLGLVLRALLLVEEFSQRVDEPKLVDLLARCTYPSKVPRRKRRVWPARIQLYWDQSQLLWPFRADQFEVVQWLRRWRGEQGLEEILIDRLGRAHWYSSVHSAAPRQPRPPDLGTTVLALSDLGCAKSGDPRRASWYSRGQQAQRVGARLRALVLSLPGRWDSQLVNLWGGISWNNARSVAARSSTVAAIGESARAESVERLLTLLAPSVRIEWALLGSARRRVLVGFNDILTESDAWSDERAVARNPLGFVIQPEERVKLLDDFRRLARKPCAQMKDLLKQHHGMLSPVVLAEELMALGDEQSKNEGSERLAKHLRLLAARGAPTEAEISHARRFAGRQSPENWSDEANAAFWALHHARGGHFDEPLPDGLPIDKVVWALDRIPPQSTCSLWQRGQWLYIMPANDQNEPALQHAGVHLADLPMAVRQLELEWRVHNRRLQVQRFNAYSAFTVAPFRDEPQANRLIVRSDLATLDLLLETQPDWSKTLFCRKESDLHCSATHRAFVKSGSDETQQFIYPPWARRVESDTYGLIAELEIAPNVFTRLRWIPPGRFLMGSPEDEVGRLKYEGPQHWVKLTHGYWLAETPCTQAEWEAVMGVNPSEFKGDGQRPVEQVSWDDCQEFCDKLKERLPGLDARLPTEAEWEYACRAGTTTPFSFGDNITPEQVNYDGNYPYADGSKGKYRRQTVPAGTLPANGWGIHEMHGNVWEWCMDAYAEYEPAERVDPTGPTEGRDRVFRGGGWLDLAQDCRSAYRSWLGPGLRWFNLGFRLVAAQVSQGAQGTAPSKQGEVPAAVEQAPRSGAGAAAARRRGAGAR